MHRVFTYFVFVLFAQNVCAQTHLPAQPVTAPLSEAGSIGFFIGAAVPTGQYASKSYSDSTAGFAKTGLIAGLTASYVLSDKVSITGQFSSFANDIDEASMLKQIAAKYPGYGWSLKADNWQVKTFLAGFSYRLPLDGAELDLSVLIGGAGATSPEIFLTGTKSGLSNTAKVSSASAGAYCFMLGATLKKELAPKICLLVNGAFLHTRPQFINVNTSFTSGAGTTSNFYQDIAIFNFSVGLAYRFVKG